MKVAVLLHWNEGEDSGVFKKVVSQIRTWRDQGVCVSLHLISQKLSLGVWQQYLEKIVITFHVYYNALTRLKAWQEAVEALNVQQPDLVYHRYDLYMPPLRRLFQRFPLILEINTDDLTEYCITKGLRCWYNRVTRSLLLHRTAGLVFVTHELSSLPHFTRYRKPFSVIANGIALNDYPVLPAPMNREPRLFFIGTDRQPWQGVDKILRMAQLFPQWQFDIVGIRPDRFRGVPANVHIHGPLSRQAYEPLLAQADIAIGTLALHRKKVNEACPLKVREYLAYGLPTIIGYKDTDFPSGAPFILGLPNTEDNVENNVAMIAGFVSEWKERRVQREAIYHLDLRVKESQRLMFFRDVLEVRH